jgi:hypothetical protein
MNREWPVASYFNSGTSFARSVLPELELVSREGWYELYRRRSDGTYWRLDADDRYQQRFLVRIDNLNSWASFDSTGLEKTLLLEKRGGLSEERCLWKDCESLSVNGSAYCVDHTYATGVRK